MVWIPWEPANQGGDGAASTAAEAEVPEVGNSQSSDSESDSEDGANSVVDNCEGSNDKVGKDGEWRRVIGVKIVIITMCRF